MNATVEPLLNKKKNTVNYKCPYATDFSLQYIKIHMKKTFNKDSFS